MPFSWKVAQENAIKKKIIRNKILAKGAHNPDFNLAHPDWVREAQNNKFTVLENKTREEMKKGQDIAIERRNKVAGKK